MALFGSKPLVDLEAVTGPVKTPVINQPGLGGYFGRVLDPSTNNSPLGRALGMFGQNLMAQQPGIGGDIGRAMVGVQEQQERQKDSLLQRQLREAQVRSLGQKGPQLSTAARMAQEMGLMPGSADYVNFIRRYAFKPTILQIPNAVGGTDYTEYDPSGASASGGLQPGVIEDGYRYNGGDPSNPASWSKL